MFGFTDSAILMEDISQSDTFRLATKEDLDDVAIASKILIDHLDLFAQIETLVPIDSIMDEEVEEQVDK